MDFSLKVWCVMKLIKMQKKLLIRQIVKLDDKTVLKENYNKIVKIGPSESMSKSKKYN